MGRVVLQYSHCTSDTACKLGARHRRAGRASARGAQADARQGRSAGAHGRARALGEAWACCWAVGCALGALSLFLTQFDSILFLSQFLDIVREPGS